MGAQTENKMGTMPVNKLLVNISLPMVISMLVQALYNIVDSIFVARIDENALTAVSLAFPMQNFMIAVAAGTGVGVNALLSKRLGEKRYRLVYQRLLPTGKYIFLSVRRLALGCMGSFAPSGFYRRPGVRSVR